MRMVKMQQETLTLEEAVQKFLMEKDAQHTGAAAMTDYRNCLARFVKSSHNSIEYDLLDADVLAFFSSIPDTSPARYNKPFQNVNAFFFFFLEQEYISKSPIKVHKLHKRKDEGNIKPVPVSDLTTFIASLDRRTYTGLRDYVIILLMLDTGVRTKEHSPTVCCRTFLPASSSWHRPCSPVPERLRLSDNTAQHGLYPNPQIQPSR